MKEFDIFKAPLTGVSLVEAGAGTGKTYNIASLFVRAILEQELLPANILVLTYTEAATAELKFRLRNRIKDSIEVLEGAEPADPFLEEIRRRYSTKQLPNLKDALYRFDDAPVSTIHGFCQRLLKENPIKFGVSPEFDILTDERELLQKKVDQYWRKLMQESSDDFHQSIQQLMVDEGMDPDKLLGFIKPVLSKSYASIVPELSPLSEYQDRFKKVKSAFLELRAQLQIDKDRIIELLDSGMLNGNTYNKNKHFYFEAVLNWSEQEIIPLKPVDKLHLFSSHMVDKVKKAHSNDFEAPELLSTVDHYLSVVEEIQDVKLSIIQNAIFEGHDAFEESKKARDVLTYDDLLETVSKGLTNEISKKLRSKYPIALVDEFQDTDPVQYSIFRSIYGNTEDSAIYMIGDPKQAIYKFRGADIHTYLSAREDARFKFSLGYNFRSNAQIIAGVNEFFSHSKHPFLLKDLEFSPAKFPEAKSPSKGLLKHKGESTSQMQILEYKPDSGKAGDIRSEVAESTASEIVNLLSEEYTIDDRKLEQSDIAVLVRTNSQALLMQEVLRNRGLRSVIKNRESVFTSSESEELNLILKAIENPAFEDRIRAALATESLGFSAQQILELNENESSWEDISARFLDLSKQWKQYGFYQIAEQLLHDFRIELNLSSHADAERRITNLYHLIELLKKAERDDKLTPNGLIRYFDKKRMDSSQTSDEEVIRLESDEQLVQIVTVHASKGLEYPVVFCPYLWEGIKTDKKIPDILHKNGETVIDLGTEGEEQEENRLLSLKDDLAETVRLAYVALTRAESACFVYAVEDIRFEFSALSCLMEGEDVVYARLHDKITLTSSVFKKEHDLNSFKMMLLLKELGSSPDIEFRQALLNDAKWSDPISTETDHLKSKRYTGNALTDYPQLLSFSSLSDSAKEMSFQLDKPGFDYDDSEYVGVASRDTEKTIFTLPKGAKTGTMLHNIFEHIEFGDSSTYAEVIRNEIIRAGLEEDWFDVVQQSIKSVLDHKLMSDIRLADLVNEDLIDEMEFHFPVADIDFRSIMQIIRGEEEQEPEEMRHGFLKGYIDLTFRANGQFYILDYKSNYLGDQYSDYSPRAIQQEMKHSYYDLQYHIYTVAIHRLLKTTLPDYDYDRDFGGVFYVFLRGVNPETDGSGIFFDKPDFEIISGLDHLFEGGNK